MGITGIATARADMDFLSGLSARAELLQTFRMSCMLKAPCLPYPCVSDKLTYISSIENVIMVRIRAYRNLYIH